MGSRAAIDSRVAMINRAAMDSCLPLVIPHKLDPTAKLQVNIANIAAATGSRVHSNRTTPIAWVFMGRGLKDFLDQDRTRALMTLITGTGEEGDLIMEAWAGKRTQWNGSWRARWLQ